MKWLDPVACPLVKELQETFGRTILLGNHLARLGFESQVAVNSFLDTQKYLPTSPFDFPDMEKAVTRIHQAVQKRELIAIWGDFDVDGQTSTALLLDGLRSLGADVVFHVPVRGDESHGIGIEKLKEFLVEKPGLLITCDTGITEFESLEFIAGLGLDVILTDHHTPADTLPKSHSVINPKLLALDHPFYPLAGVGTAFQLLRGVFELSGDESRQIEYFDLVALGTIADLAELIAENRYYAKKGLEQINKSPRCALKTILDLAGFKDQLISESHLGFTLAPRLNAAGRLSDANPIVEFLISKQKDVVREIALHLEELNARRKVAVEMVYKSALHFLEKQPTLLQYPAIILAKSGWEGGVVGIAASKLVEKYHKPVVLMNLKDGISVGSARSVEGVNLIQAIRENAEYLIRFGGHPMAAGLSIKPDNIPLFHESLSNSVMAQIRDVPAEPELQIDAILPFSHLGEELLVEMDLLAPFGPGNSPPVLVSQAVEIDSQTLIGKSREHRRLTLRDKQGSSMSALWWNSADKVLPSGLFDLAYYARRDQFKNRLQVILEWVDHRESTPESIDLRHPKIKSLVKDYRLSAHALDDLSKKIKNQAEIQCWAEGGHHQYLSPLSRHELTKGGALAILTPPPSIQVLQETLSHVSPREVFLFALPAPDDSLKGFLDAVSRLASLSLTNSDGSVLLDSLCGLIGHTSVSVLAGLDWWKFHGDLDYHKEGNRLFIQKTNLGISSQIKPHTLFVQSLLRETAAFRNYYLRADPAVLLDFPGI